MDHSPHCSGEFVLAFDISTKTGYALLEKLQDSDSITLLHTGLLTATKADTYYPVSYLEVAANMALQIVNCVKTMCYDYPSITMRGLCIVIEETNQSKNRYSQKLIEWIHCLTAKGLLDLGYCPVYVNSSDWQRHLDIRLSAEDRKSNKKLSQAKSKAKSRGLKLDKTRLGIRGKKTLKHVAIRFVNDRFQLELKQKDNDIADAICLGVSFLEGVSLCTGQ